MKLFLSADIEGTCGIASWDETEIGTPKYPYFADQMSLEVAAACRGAMKAGADDILVKDAHDSARNLDPRQMPQCVRLMRGWTRTPLVMMAGLDEGGFAGALFTGCHCAAGLDGNPLAHTMSQRFTEILLNDEICSEWLLNAFAAAYLGVPVRFVSGDAAVCEQARRHQKNIRFVATNTGIGNAALSIHPDLAVGRIEEEAEAAMRAPAEEMRMPLPGRFHIRIRYREHYNALRNGFYPGVRQTGPTTVEYETEDYFELLRALLFIL